MPQAVEQPVAPEARVEREAFSASPVLKLHIAQGSFEGNLSPTVPDKVADASYMALEAQHNRLRTEDNKKQREKLDNLLTDEQKQIIGNIIKASNMKKGKPPIVSDEEIYHFNHMLTWSRVEANRIADILSQARSDPARGKMAIEVFQNTFGINFTKQTEGIAASLFNTELNQSGSFYRDFCTGDTNAKLADKLSVDQMYAIKPFIEDVLGDHSGTAFNALIALRETKDALSDATQKQEMANAVNNSLPSSDTSVLDFYKAGWAMVPEEKRSKPIETSPAKAEGSKQAESPSEKQLSTAEDYRNAAHQLLDILHAKGQLHSIPDIDTLVGSSAGGVKRVLEGIQQLNAFPPEGMDWLIKTALGSGVWHVDKDPNRDLIRARVAYAALSSLVYLQNHPEAVEEIRTFAEKAKPLGLTMSTILNIEGSAPTTFTFSEDPKRSEKNRLIRAEGVNLAHPIPDILQALRDFTFTPEQIAKLQEYGVTPEAITAFVNRNAKPTDTLESTAKTQQTPESPKNRTEQIMQVIDGLNHPGINRLGKEIALKPETLQLINSFTRETLDLLNNNQELQTLLKTVSNYAIKDPGFAMAVGFGNGIIENSSLTAPRIVPASGGNSMRIELPSSLYTLYHAYNSTKMAIDILKNYQNSPTEAGAGHKFAYFLERTLAGYNVLTKPTS